MFIEHSFVKKTAQNNKHVKERVHETQQFGEPNTRDYNIKTLPYVQNIITKPTFHKIFYSNMCAFTLRNVHSHVIL